MNRWASLVGLCCLLSSGFAWAEPVAGGDEQALAAKVAALPAAVSNTVEYGRDIAPIFMGKCQQCHGPEKHKGGLRLDASQGLRLGGDSGAAVKAGDALGSKLFQLVAGLDDSAKMPPTGDGLSAAELALLRAWIEQGAVLPEGADDAPLRVESDHWSFQPVSRPELPPVQDEAWPRNAIDHFILSKIEAAGYAPAPEAEKSVQMRRLYLDLVGLPPTPAEVAEYMADDSPHAYERLVNRLLASQHFGERWARHWLDLARYADSDGYEKDTGRPWAWRYREWVIEAYNRDLPYDQFIIKQIAGDLLPNATSDDLAATGFHRNTLTNKEGGVDQEEFRVAQVVDRTNTTGAVVLGLTVACAQCHTHKYDPITQREYYQLYGFFNSGMERDVPAPKDEEVALYKRRKADFDTGLAKLDRQLADRAEQLKEGLGAWEAEQDAADIAWSQLEPVAWRTGNGPFLDRLEDGSIVATGAAYDRDTYVVEVDTHLKGITGFRLEAVPDDRLPNRGPGRASDGNFVITRFDVQQKPLAEVVEVGNLARFAVASSPDGLDTDGGSGPDAAAIDGDENTFWDEEDGKERYVFQADFGEARTISAISLTGYEHESHAPRDFEVVLDGEVVLSVVDAAYEANFLVAAFPAKTGKSLQLNITKAYGGSPTIRELGIYDALPEQIRLSRMPLAPVRLVEAHADHEQPGFPARNVIDGDDRSGWAVGGPPEKMHARRNVRFIASDDLSDAAGVRLRFLIGQNFGGQHTLGRFKLYATTDPRVRQTLPDVLRPILQVASDRRSPAQQNALLTHFAATFDLATKEMLAKRSGLMEAAPTPPDTLAQAIVENPDPPATHVLIRGDFLQKGDPVDNGTLAVLPPLRARGAKADRLDFARWLVAEDNPLSPRVAVNRVWDKLFGVGLMRTPEDWGTRSEAPTHPELLDWLAAEHVARGWSTKDLIRLMVSSAAYRQSSHVRGDLLETDPANTLFARQNAFRVEGEIVRDLFLAAGGLLNRAVGGPSVRPVLPPGITDLSYASSVTWPVSSGEDLYRRGMYIWFQRTIAFPQLMAFDCPDSNVTMIRRNRSNTPLQALTLLNDQAFVECAQALGARMVAECGGTPEQRLQWAFGTCMGRTPTAEETGLLLELYENQVAYYQDKPALAEKLVGRHRVAALSHGEAAAYMMVARTILNLDEFVTRE